MSGRRILATGGRIFHFTIPLATLALFLLAFVPGCASAECTVRGSVYDWATFGTVSNAIIEVYSLPDITLTDQKVTTTGNYSFVLPEGSYMIRASSGTPGTPDEIAAYENVTVPAAGERTIDLVLFPLENTDDISGYVDDNATATPEPTESPAASPIPTPQRDQEDLTLFLGAGAILLAIIAIAAGLLFLRRNKRRLPTQQPYVKEEPQAAPQPAAQAPEPVEEQKQEPPGPQPPAEIPPPDEPRQLPPQPQSQQPQQPSAMDLLLPQDCREVLAIMEKNGGRITQLDLRKALPYSEAKVSLIVSDLESRGLVKKIKKGRGNVLIINRPGERPPE